MTEETWTHEAVEAALDTIKTLPFETDKQKLLAMRRALMMAKRVQEIAVLSHKEPAEIVDEETGLRVGHWAKEDDGRWHLYAIMDE
jgi:hypothetical protein